MDTQIYTERHVMTDTGGRPVYGTLLKQLRKAIWMVVVALFINSKRRETA